MGLRLYGLRGEVARAKAFGVAREAERDAVLARLAAEEDLRKRVNDLAEKRGKEITRLWGVLRRTGSDEALDALLKEELGG